MTQTCIECHEREAHPDSLICEQCSDELREEIPSEEELTWEPDRSYAAGYAYACGYFD